LLNSHLILGIDPGLNITGYGIIKIDSGLPPQLFKYGHIRTNSKASLADRLHKIFTGLTEVLEQQKPDQVAIENIFYADNVKTAIIMGHARGAAMVAAVNSGAQVAEYSPREIKMSVVGNGGAVKSQVSFMVRSILKLRENIEPDDASDALAVALCHWHRLGQVK